MCNSLDGADTKDPFTWSVDNDGGSGGWEVKTAKALFMQWYNLIEKWVDRNSNENLMKIYDNITGNNKTICIFLLENFYKMVKDAEDKKSAIMKINCLANSMDFSSSDCSTNFSDPNNTIGDIHPDLFEWSIEKYDVACPEAGVQTPFTNPLCDLVSQGYSAQDINVILNNLKSAMDGGPGYTIDGSSPSDCSLNPCEANELTSAIIENINTFDPCDSESSVVATALNNSAANGGCGALGFLSELKNMTYIDYSFLKENCPKYYCVMQKLSSGADNWFCNNISEIATSTNYTYEFIFNNTSFIQTTYLNEGSPDKNKIITKIPMSYCGGDSGLSDLELASKFIHETFHAMFFGWIFDSNDGGYIYWKNFSPSSDFWLEMVAKRFEPDPITGNHHALFLTEYKEIIMEALWKLNGMQGKKVDYEYYAHILINTQNMAEDLNDTEKVNKFPWLAELGLENFDIEDYENAWESNILDIYGYNDNCP